MSWNDHVSITNKTEARAKIQKSTYLDQWYPKEKQSLKISLNFRDDQPERLNKKPAWLLRARSKIRLTKLSKETRHPRR